MFGIISFPPGFDGNGQRRGIEECLLADEFPHILINLLAAIPKASPGYLWLRKLSFSERGLLRATWKVVEQICSCSKYHRYWSSTLTRKSLICFRLFLTLFPYENEANVSVLKLKTLKIIKRTGRLFRKAQLNVLTLKNASFSRSLISSHLKFHGLNFTAQIRFYVKLMFACWFIFCSLLGDVVVKWKQASATEWILSSNHKEKKPPRNRDWTVRVESVIIFSGKDRVKNYLLTTYLRRKTADIINLVSL